MFRPLLCLLHGGHRWETVTDSAGSITSCARCRQVRHAGVRAGDSFLRSHTNLGYEIDATKPRDRDGRGSQPSD